MLLGGHLFTDSPSPPQTFLSKIFPNMEDSGNPRLEEKVSLGASFLTTSPLLPLPPLQAAANILKLYNKAIGRSKKLRSHIEILWSQYFSYFWKG